MKTKAEIRAWFESKVGTTVKTKPSGSLDGQCVTLEKALLEFLGVPEPYKARGHAKDYATNLVNAGIATNGKGWLNVVVNPDMSKPYGHIWNDLSGEANYEQNGAKALKVTKNTRPVSQGKQFVNLDKWIKGENEVLVQNAENWYQRLNKLHEQLLRRPLSREVFKNYVGKDMLFAVESFSDHAETQKQQVRFNTLEAENPKLKTEIEKLKANQTEDSKLLNALAARMKG